MDELDGIYVLKHSSIRIDKNGIIIYIDPFQIDIANHDADLILCTHPHYDHFSPNDIKAVSNDSTIIIATPDCVNEAKKIGFKDELIEKAFPGEIFSYENIIIECVPAYNKYKEFHPKEKNWVGYILTIDGIVYYIAGDTDKTKEACKVKCDVAFLPVGGTYTMNYAEAASLANKIKPQSVVPTHYGLIVGDSDEGIKFSRLIEKDIKCKLFY